MATAKTDTDYLALARKVGTTPSRQKSFRKIFVYARNKKGKTKLGLSVGRDNIVFADPEMGTALMLKEDPFLWPIEKWEDLQDLYGACRTGKLSPNHLVQGESSTPFSWVSPDGLTKMHNMALKYVMKVQELKDLDRQPGMVQRQDYGKANELMKQMIINFQTLKMNVYYTAQEKMMTADGKHDFSEDDDEDSMDVEAYFVPALPDGVRGYINSQAEVIGRLYVVAVDDPKNADKKVKQRRLQIGLHDKYDTGFRSDWALPDVIRRPSLPKLVKLIEEGAS